MFDQAYKTIGARCRSTCRKGGPSRSSTARRPWAWCRRPFDEALPVSPRPRAQTYAMGRPSQRQAAVLDEQDFECPHQDRRTPIQLYDLDGIAVEDQGQGLDNDRRAAPRRAARALGTPASHRAPGQGHRFVYLDLAATIGDEEIQSVTDVSYKIAKPDILARAWPRRCCASARADQDTGALTGGDAKAAARCTVTSSRSRSRAANWRRVQPAGLHRRCSRTCAPTSSSRPHPRNTARASRPATRCSSTSSRTIDHPRANDVVYAKVNQRLKRHPERRQRRAKVGKTYRERLAQDLLDAISEQLEVRVKAASTSSSWWSAPGVRHRRPRPDHRPARPVPWIVQDKVTRPQALSRMLDKATVEPTPRDGAAGPGRPPMSRRAVTSVLGATVLLAASVAGASSAHALASGATAPNLDFGDVAVTPPSSRTSWSPPPAKPSPSVPRPSSLRSVGPRTSWTTSPSCPTPASTRSPRASRAR